MASLDIKRMHYISIIWGILLFTIVGLLTAFGFYYKKQTQVYKEYEKTITKNTKEYLQNNALLPDEEIKISLEELIQNQVINVLEDKKCDGYIVVRPDMETHSYKTYLKCLNYKTRGYEE